MTIYDSGYLNVTTFACVCAHVKTHSIFLCYKRKD